MSVLKHLDIFSGIGGFAYGLQMVGGYETIGFCEIDKYCQKVLKKHWPDVPVYEDVTTLDYEQFSGQIDIITGGFPCQDLSIAGRGAGLSGERSGLYRYLLDAIRVVRPRYAVVENVAALLSRGMGTILGDLAEIGYNAEWHCIPASSVGAPHQRDRVWVIAHDNRQRGWLQQINQELKDQADTNDDGKKGSMAYSERMRELQPQGSEQDQRGWVGDGSQKMADPTSKRCRQMEQSKQSGTRSERASSQIEYSSFARRWEWWETEPDVGRVANGIPKRVDRLRGLGNAVVPQIVEILGRAILDVSTKKSP